MAIYVTALVHPSSYTEQASLCDVEKDTPQMDKQILTARICTRGVCNFKNLCGIFRRREEYMNLVRENGEMKEDISYQFIRTCTHT